MNPNKHLEQYRPIVDKLLLFLMPLIVIAFFLMSSQLLAHQKKEAITRVIFNERLNNIEIIHRFSIHDAEHAAKMLFGKSTDLIDSPDSQEQFANYVLENFSISKNAETPITLTSVGFEIDARYIWIYQETALQSDIESLLITHNALRDVWPDQVNLLNVERTLKDSLKGKGVGKKEVRSLVFKGSLAPKTLTLKTK
ncbi:MAG: hypothetical protein ACI9IA_002473 [Enterobacterales bacterium]|jgi:hypothetical protein